MRPVELPSIHEVLDKQGVRTHFQPILSARKKAIVGLEALSRGIPPGSEVSWTPGGQTLIPPLTLLQMAAQAGVGHRLEQLCRETAVRTFAALPDRPDDLVLFMNFELSSTLDDYATEQLRELLQSTGIRPRNVAIEILESRIDDFDLLCHNVARFRELGFLVVLDDVGAGHSNLDRIPLIRPDILKVDRGLITNISGDYYKQETFKSLVGLSRRIGALVVAEGVETEDEAMVSLELGADFLQGYFLGKAREVTGFTDNMLSEATAKTQALAKKFKSYMVGKINERKLQHRRFNVILNQLLCEVTNALVDEFGSLLTTAIARYPNVECIYVLDDAGVQITETICATQSPGRTGVMFNPAPKGADHSLKEYYYILMDVELQKFTTDPYVSLASGNVCRTISTAFRDAATNRMYVLCIDVRGDDAVRDLLSPSERGKLTPDGLRLLQSA